MRTWVLSVASIYISQILGALRTGNESYPALESEKESPPEVKEAERKEGPQGAQD